MQIPERRSGDLAKRKAAARREARAEQRDRLLAVAKADAVATASGRTRVFFMDEARSSSRPPAWWGQLRDADARLGGSRSPGRGLASDGGQADALRVGLSLGRPQSSDWEPSTGASVALQAPHANTATMSVFLRMLAEEIGADEHAIVVMDPSQRGPAGT